MPSSHAISLALFPCAVRSRTWASRGVSSSISVLPQCRGAAHFVHVRGVFELRMEAAAVFLGAAIAERPPAAVDVAGAVGDQRAVDDFALFAVRDHGTAEAGQHGGADRPQTAGALK